MPKYNVIITKAILITKTYTVDVADNPNGSEDENEDQLEDERIDAAEDLASESFYDDVTKLDGYDGYGPDDSDCTDTDKIK